MKENWLQLKRRHCTGSVQQEGSWEAKRNSKDKKKNEKRAFNAPWLSLEVGPDQKQSFLKSKGYIQVRNWNLQIGFSNGFLRDSITHGSSIVGWGLKLWAWWPHWLTSLCWKRYVRRWVRSLLTKNRYKNFSIYVRKDKPTILLSFLL